jgi:hypothetical protein
MARTRLGSRGSFSGQVVEKITAAETILNGDSGKVFIIDASGGSAYTITLPTTLKAGVNYQFKLKANGDIITVTAGSAIIYGQVLSGDASTAKVEESGGTAKTSVAFAAAAEAGAQVDFLCDGTYWYVRGSGTADNWLVFA